VLANGLQQVEIVAFDEPEQAGLIFAPDTVVTVDVGMLEVLVSELEAIRQQLASAVRPEDIERAHALQAATAQGIAVSAGKKADKRFSEALNAYAKEPSGIPAADSTVRPQKVFVRVGIQSTDSSSTLTTTTDIYGNHPLRERLHNRADNRT